MPRAERDMADIYLQIAGPTSQAARAWYRGLRNLIRTLREHPYRCPTTAEDPSLRHLLYGRKPHIYRVIYRVKQEPKQVEVLHVRHRARREFGGDDIE